MMRTRHSYFYFYWQTATAATTPTATDTDTAAAAAAAAATRAVAERSAPLSRSKRTTDGNPFITAMRIGVVPPYIGIYTRTEIRL